MATDQQINANRSNAQHSTGPRTAAGKAVSARNALTLGLFTKSDYVRPAEQAEFDALKTRYVTELNPLGIVEDTCVKSLVSATWRLRRCSLVERELAGSLDVDPMLDAVGSKIQDSVDRARMQGFNLLRRATAELRRLQTDRAIAAHLARLEALSIPAAVEETALVSQKHVVVCIDQHQRFKNNQDKVRQLASLCKNDDRRAKTEPTPIDRGKIARGKIALGNIT